VLPHTPECQTPIFQNTNELSRVCKADGLFEETEKKVEETSGKSLQRLERG
jgi:hypothetical protein